MSAKTTQFSKDFTGNTKENDEFNRLIDSFNKNSQDLIKIIVTGYRGTLLLDIRSWRKDDAAFNAGKPTKKGVSISLDLFPRFLKAMRKTEKYLEKHKEEIKQMRKLISEKGNSNFE